MKSTLLKKTMPFMAQAAVLLAVLALSYFQAFEHYELNALDMRFALRPTVKVSDKVVLIEIGEDTIKNLGRFPFDRSYHAILIKALYEFGAKAVVFDLFFSEPDEHDGEMEEAMRQAKNVYLPYVFDLEKRPGQFLPFGRFPVADNYIARCLENFTVLAKGTGHINVIPDRDGKYRRIPIYIKYGNALYPYLSFAVACDYLGIKEKDISIAPGRYIQCGDKLRIPLDERSGMIVNYSGKWGKTYRHYSYFDILKSYIEKALGKASVINTADFKDKVCVIGLTATGTSDTHPNPFDPLYPAVGIHTEVFSSMITGNFITRLTRAQNLAVLLGFILLILWVTFTTKPLQGFFLLVLTAVLFSVLSIFLFNYYGVWVDVVCPMFVMAFTYLSITLYKYAAEWKKRLVLESELDIAKKIQVSFLPKDVPKMKGLDIAVKMLTARQVGGDLYDFMIFDDKTLGVMIGDVSGKGVPASLFMAMTAGSFKFFASKDAYPKDVLTRLNQKIVKESSSNLFVTMFYAVLDMGSKTMSYGNGGHLPLAYLSPGKKIEFLDVDEGVPLGLMECVYSGKEISFRPGDVMVFYTDGVTEAMNSKGDMYERDRLAAVIESNRYASASALLAAIEKDVRRFEPKSQQHDDITVLVVKVTEG